MARSTNSPNKRLTLRRIVSGGQTGVDRAALDTAIFLELEHGGWCPLGRRAEDGPIDPVYQLRETLESDYAIRTERNVIDSDGTLILCRGKLTGGTRLTERLARKHDRICLVINLEWNTARDNKVTLVDWIIENQIQCLNVAGPRESTSPEIGKMTEHFLVYALSENIGTPEA